MGAVYLNEGKLMKRFLCLLLALFMVASMIVVAGAGKVEKEQYTIELPDGFVETDESRFVGTNKENLLVKIEENTDDTICVADMSQRDVEDYVNNVAELSKSAFELVDRQGSMEVLSAGVEKHVNGREVLVATYKTTAVSEAKTTVLYQRVYDFSCVNNKYSFVFTAQTEKELDDFKPAFDSIAINEAENKGFKGDIGAYITVGIVFGLFILGIIRFIRTPAKRKAGKIKNKK